MTVIEELTLTMAPEAVTAFIERDAAVWTPFLQTCAGYLGKEIWLPDDRPGTVVIIIRWASREQWKRISPDQVAEVDRAMGSLVPDTLECRSYDVA